MKVPIGWLKDYVDVTLPPPEIARRLTLAGNEVDRLEVIGGGWESIVVGEIKAVNPHPNADRLRLVTVNWGSQEKTVVCGAPNLNIGDKIAFASVGARLIDGHSGKIFRLKAAKIRDIVSAGMVCSEKELGLSAEHGGILVLPTSAPLGKPLFEVLGDVVFNLEITPNRPDCLSIIGIAREISALTGQGLHIPPVAYREAASPVEPRVSVSIADADLCLRYSASLISGVTVGESPQWLKKRLESCGLRPINNIVDITNYVMLEYGQPLHAFDYDRISGGEIIVRRARDGEKIVSLDGVTRSLSREMLVIADREKAVAIAGVMGGANSEVSPATTAILLESANFFPTSVHYTGRQLKLPSEACTRFERGISRGLTIPALGRATQLIVELTGGEASGVVDTYPGRQEPESILLPKDKVNKVLGTSLTRQEIRGALSSLGFDCKPGPAAGEVLVTPPYWRSDIHLAVDLVEEVARVVGYDRIPMTMLSQSLPRQDTSPLLELKRSLRRMLSGWGFQEMISFSLVSREMLLKLTAQDELGKPVPLRVSNPMSEEQEYLRPTLRANLLSALAANRRFEDGGIRLFEIGRVYLPNRDELPDEPEILCGLIAGLREEKSWQSDNKLIDFYDAKGVIEGVFSYLGITPLMEPSRDEAMSPGRQAAIIIGGTEVGVIGELHPRVLSAFEISEAVCLFELNIEKLLSTAAGHKMFQSLARYPAIVRDIALLLDTNVTHQRVLDIIRLSSLVRQVLLFDVYSGKQVPPGKKSLAYRLTFQSEDHTLTDAEVDGIQRKILAKLSDELGATLRA